MLQGIGYGFSISEILDGKPKSAGSEVWEGIRGGRARALFVRRGARIPSQKVILLTVVFGSRSDDEPVTTYSLGILPEVGSVQFESLKIGERPVFYSVEVEHKGKPALEVLYNLAQGRSFQNVEMDASRPRLHHLLTLDLGKPDLDVVKSCIRALSNIQRVEPSLPILRDYSLAPTVDRMGERGENFAALVKSILADPAMKSAYASWLQQLTPAEVDDVEILEGALKEPLFALKDGANVFPAPVLSDGTLRFAALAAAFFQPDPPDVLTIEEIENAIHPSRLRLLVELLKSQSWPHGPQVFATTHSPAVLSWLAEEDLATTFLCRRDEETGASRITPLSEIPRLVELAREQPIGELFTEGWLEGAA